MLKYRIIALDLDGTLTRSDKKISPYTADVLVKAQEMGVKLVLASGRPTNGMMFLADELKMDRFGGMILAFNGGEITDCSNGNIIHRIPFPDEAVPLIYDFASKRGFCMMTYAGKQILTEAAGNEYVMQSSFRNRMSINVVDSFIASAREYGTLPKCMVVGKPDELEVFEEELRTYADGMEEMKGVDFFRSEPYYLEIVPKGIDKGKCMPIVLRHYGLEPEQLIACGDAFNDLGMIKYAGLGVAMGNGQACVKEAADYITDSNEADGVAKVVERFVLSAQS